MTDRISPFSLTIPANGSLSSIFFVDCELGDSNVTKIVINFPPGCASLVGIRVEHGGSQVYPSNKGTFFVFDDYTLEIEPSEQGTSGQWHVAGYNLDIYPHTITSYFFYDYVNLKSSGGSSPLISL